MTRRVRRSVVLCGFLILPACSGPVGPTGQEIENSLARATEDATRSAEGPWKGFVGSSITLDFSLTQSVDGRLQGTGTMREGQAPAGVPIAVSGSYNRPNLALTFTGMVYEGRNVEGTFAAPYTSFLGVNGTLRLTSDNYARSLNLSLREP